MNLKYIKDGYSPPTPLVLHRISIPDSISTRPNPKRNIDLKDSPILTRTNPKRDLECRNSISTRNNPKRDLRTRVFGGFEPSSSLMSRYQRDGSANKPNSAIHALKGEKRFFTENKFSIEKRLKI